MPEHLHKRKHLTSFQLIILGFAGVILIGALILTLPVSSASGVVTPFDQALFTSTSAVCVTGLVVQDTGLVDVYKSQIQAVTGLFLDRQLFWHLYRLEVWE